MCTPWSRDSLAAWSHVSLVLADVPGVRHRSQEVGLCIHMMYTRVCVYTHVCVHVSGWGRGGHSWLLSLLPLDALENAVILLFHHFLLISFSWN